MCLAWRRARFTPVPALGPSWRKVEDSRRDTKPRLMRIFIRSDRKSTRLNSSHLVISYAVFCLKKKKRTWDQSNDCVLPSPGALRPNRVPGSPTRCCDVNLSTDGRDREIADYRICRS